MSDTASQPIKLPAVMDFAAAESFLHTMTGCAKQEDGVRLDASEVRTLTFSCVQILLAAIKDCGDRLVIEGPSEEFLRTFNELALSALIESNIGTGSRQDKSIGGPQDALPEPAFVTQQPAAEEPAAQETVTQESVVQEPAAEASAVEASAAEVRSVDVPVVDVAPADAPPAHTPVAEQISPTDDFEETPMSQRILTVDDSRTIRDMLMLTLSGAGFNVVQAVDGQEGIDILEKETFDVVITDINMPKKDGYDVIRAMRANPAHKGIPILVLTTEADTEKRQIAREAGATGWMVKPFDPEKLVATVRKVAP